MEKAKAQRGIFRDRLNLRLGVGLGLAMVWILAGCAAVSPGSKSGAGAEPGDYSQSVAGGSGSEPSKSGRKFTEPGELDKLLDAKPIALATVKPASQGTAAGTAAQAKAPEPAASGRGKFRIQISAESDVDAAQAKKEVLEKKLGGTVDVVFDPPYYKLRWGYFESKQEAEDKLLELSDQKIQGFVVKQ